MQNMDLHISESVLTEALKDPSGPLPAELDSHLERCGACRTLLRSVVARSVEPHRKSVTAGCLSDDEHARYARRQMDPVEFEGAELHISTCQDCRALVQDLREFDAELVARYATEPEAASAAPVKPTVRAWLESVRRSALVSTVTLRAPQPALGFSSGDAQTPTLHLTFNEPGLLGSYRVEEGRKQLHIEHTDWRPGTLVLLTVADGDEFAWRRFAVTRAGFRRSVVDLVVDDDGLEHRRLSVVPVGIEELPSGLAAELAAGYESAADDHPHARGAWKKWAESVAPLGDLPADVRQVAQTILEE